MTEVLRGRAMIAICCFTVYIEEEGTSRWVDVDLLLFARCNIVVVGELISDKAPPSNAGSGESSEVFHGLEWPSSRLLLGFCILPRVEQQCILD